VNPVFGEMDHFLLAWVIHVKPKLALPLISVPDIALLVTVTLVFVQAVVGVIVNAAVGGVSTVIGVEFAQDSEHAFVAITYA
jgi:hypothetical protein